MRRRSHQTLSGTRVLQTRPDVSDNALVYSYVVELMASCLEANKESHAEMVSKVYSNPQIANGHTLIVTDRGYLCGVLYNSTKNVESGERLKVVDKQKIDFSEG